MSTNTIIDKLRTEGKSNPAAGAVFLVWSQRQRARASVTLSALYATMKEEGFPISTDKLQGVLAFVASLGLGTLVKNHKGQIIALTNVRNTLQSIGEAAMNGSPKLASFNQRVRFTALPAATKAEISIPKAPEEAQKVLLGMPVKLIVYVNDKAVSIPVPQDWNDTDVALLIRKFQPVKHA